MKHWFSNNKLILLFFIVSFGSLPSHAFDPYDLFESLLSSKKLPRLLNSEDIVGFQPSNPQPLISPTGDYNSDGIPDRALSGVYDLPGKSKKYFLLVGTTEPNSNRFKKLYYQEYETPVYIHKPGTTGDTDPEDQAFSISFCMGCEKGADFYWSNKIKRFRSESWRVKKRRIKKWVETPIRQVPEKVVDKALQVVGKLKDVKAFVSRVKKREGKLGTRVQYQKNSERTHIYDVIIFEKREKKEKVYDVIAVDVEEEKVVSRQR